MDLFSYKKSGGWRNGHGRVEGTEGITGKAVYLTGKIKESEAIPEGEAGKGDHKKTSEVS